MKIGLGIDINNTSNGGNGANTPNIFSKSEVLVGPFIQDIVFIKGTGEATFTRASTQYGTAADGSLIVAASGEPAFNLAAQTGILIEPERTNLFLNSAIGVTQNITTTAQVYTLSFYGTGNIVRSGTNTGTLTGTGADNRVTVSFTPTAGTLTLTVNGSCTNVQFEVGATASSRIDTTSAPVTRAVTVLSIPTAGNIQVAPSTLELQWTPNFTTAVPIANQVLWGSYTDVNNLMDIIFNGTTLIFRKRVAGTNYDATIAATATAGVTKTIVAKVLADNSTQLIVNGVAGTANANTTTPVLASTMQIGSLNGLSQTVGHIKMIRTFNS